MSRALRRLSGFSFSVGLLLGGALALQLLAGCGPLPSRVRDSTLPRQIVVVHTDSPRYFYLVDTRRSLCFFGDRRYPQLTPLDCYDLPEARDILGLDGPVAPAPEDEVPADPPPVTGDATDAGEPPTEDEITRFSPAYVEVLCAHRGGGEEETSAPDEEAIVGRHGFDLARYRQVREHLSRDAERWGQISRSAFEACLSPD